MHEVTTSAKKYNRIFNVEKKLIRWDLIFSIVNWFGHTKWPFHATNGASYCGDQLTYNNHFYKGISADTMDIKCPLNQSLFAVITQIFIYFMLICIISLDQVLARFLAKLLM